MPLVGTWIEIPGYWEVEYHTSVVPLVGTWIEIIYLAVQHPARSRAPRGHVD